MIQKDTVERMRDGHLVKHYLLASFCYYHCDMSPMTDAAFDRLCQRLHARFDAIDGTTHPHKALIDKSELEAGTCLLAYDAFPAIVKNVAFDYTAACINGSVSTDLEPHLLPAAVRPTRILRAPAARNSEPAAPSKPTRIIRRKPQ